eukprot:scaffold34213_cov24-Prasinocladus_malaysianus.AAC.1
MQVPTAHRATLISALILGCWLLSSVLLSVSHEDDPTSTTVSRMVGCREVDCRWRTSTSLVT